MWRPIRLWRLTIALMHHGCEWWFDPRRRLMLLRTRAGHLFETRIERHHIFVRKFNINPQPKGTE